MFDFLPLYKPVMTLLIAHHTPLLNYVSLGTPCFPVPIVLTTVFLTRLQENGGARALCLIPHGTN